MVLPLRSGAGGAQRLVLIERSGRGFVETELDAVRFVPLEAGKA
jgi:protein-L-isoaspartate O-methyltransferase